MFIAMNRFKVLKDCTEGFENVWFSRESYLHTLPGFIAFHLLKGPEREDHVLYSSHTTWRSYADFEGWTRSEAFRKAHARAGGSKPTTLGHPEFEGFHVIQEVLPDGAVRRVTGECPMTDTATARPPLAERLAQSADGILEQIAREYGVSTFEVVRALPAERRTVVPGSRFEEIVKTVTEWGEVLLIVHTPDIVLECAGPIPPGSFARGYFNLHGDSPIGGHIKAENCTHIAFVNRPFMGRPSRSLQFFNGAGEAMFKIFVRRDQERNLIAAQVEQFDSLRGRLARI